MKNTLLIILALGSVVVAYLCVEKSRQAREQRTTEAKQQLEQAQADAARQERQSKLLQAKLNQTRLEAASKAGEAHELKQQLANSTNSSKAPEPTPAAQLFKDPEMKAMMKKQQRENVERMVNKIVSPELVKQFNLSGEQAGYLKELLQKKYGPGADLTMELLAGELSDAQMAELGKQFKQQIAEADSQIKTYLGDDAYSSFEWQEKSQEERSRVKEFQKRLRELGQPLAPEQQEQLLRAMYEERQSFPFRVDYRDPLNYDYAHLHEFFSDDNFDLFFHDMEQLNEKVFQRLQAVLTPEQLAELQTMQRDQLEKAKVTVRMTNALLGKRAH